MNKLTLTTSLIAAALTLNAAGEALIGTPNSGQATEIVQPTLPIRTTAYTHTESDHIKYAKYTASGTTLRSETGYTSAAADWSVFPLGTEFRIKGLDRTFVIDDYGSALVGTRTIDLYQPTRQAMNEWGVQHVEIQIIKFGSYEKSAKILSGRTKYAHCKAMHTQLLAKVGN